MSSNYNAARSEKPAAQLATRNEIRTAMLNALLIVAPISSGHRRLRRYGSLYMSSLSQFVKLYS